MSRETTWARLSKLERDRRDEPTRLSDAQLKARLQGVALTDSYFQQGARSVEYHGRRHGYA